MTRGIAATDNHGINPNQTERYFDMKLTTLIAAAALALTSTGAAWAAEMVDGTIKKIDAAQKKLTIKHGELKDLEMPPMTMVFAAAEGIDLTKFKPGQKVKFTAARVNGRITVTAINN